MPLIHCPRCSSPVSDQAAACPRCGIAIAPAATGTPPQGVWEMQGYHVVPGRAPTYRWGVARWLTLAVAVLVSILAGIVGSEGAPGAEGTGMIIGGALVPFMFAALFLAWTRRTRSYFPFAALALALMTLAGQVSNGREEVNREISQTRAQMNALQDSTSSFVPPSRASHPPTGQKGKAVWAINQALAEVPAHRAMIASRHGIDPDDLPAAWGTPQYMANAGSHPEVGRYWTAYRSYLAEYRSVHPTWLRSRIEHHARVAGMRPDILRSFRQGMAKSSTSQAEEVYSLGDATAAAALELHRFLVSVDERVEYDAQRGKAIFESSAELERANELEGRVTAAARALTRAQQASVRHGRDMLDSLATVLD